MENKELKQEEIGYEEIEARLRGLQVELISRILSYKFVKFGVLPQDGPKDLVTLCKAYMAISEIRRNRMGDVC